MVFVLGFLLFALGIAISIALHEFGHLLTAKAFGMKVTRYFIGFGPKIWSFRKGETEYGLKAIPAGGFCEITGMTAMEEVDPADAPRAFYKQKTWKRVVVLSAGSITHFMVGFLVLYLSAITLGLPNSTGSPIVQAVNDCAQSQNAKTLQYDPCAPGAPAPAKAAGVQAGDVILSVDGTAVANYAAATKLIQDRQGPVPLVVERDGRQVSLTVDVVKQARVVDPKAKVGADNKTQQVGVLGLSFANMIHYGPVAAVGAASGFTGQMFVSVWEGLKRFPEKVPALIKAIGGAPRDADAPVSVVGASIIGGQAAELGLWWFFLLLLANLNFFVGVFNLLPLLPLDGGHIAVNLYERARDAVRKWRGKPAGAPVDYMKLLPLTYVLVFVGGAITLLTITADIVNPIQLSGQ
ncbi:M50 family metallopeptidase [Kutzneria viridogrisea]|uniref:PDZ domain-containing protein n=2 Tax=Kutzneria TaxID=43356 RepID=W5WII3_9PSEU|nr:site-2 protease family protein [Kutzneria albida]AHI00638.1 hypothetical protein KALB_7280 [Kutzneria albida DSM 43870]MBA8925817.1 membrane-associated protease RseP (regulator of RpoE activity) [Kutzneria viridogrisea]